MTPPTSMQSLPYSFDVSSEYARYHAYRNYRFLTSFLVKAGIVFFLGCTLVLAGGMYYYGSAPLPLIGLALVTTSVGLSLLLLLTFAATYYPYLPVRTIVSGLDVSEHGPNAAAAADFELLGLLGPYAHADNDHFFAAVRVLTDYPGVKELFRRLQLERPAVLGIFEQQLTGHLTWQVVGSSAVVAARALGWETITPEHIIAGLLLHPSLHSFLRSNDLSEEDILFNTWWVTALRRAQHAGRRWWDAGTMLRFTGIGLSWTSGFTPMVDQFSHFPKGNLWDQIIVGRERHVEQLITTLARQQQSNVLLVGQPGVGRLGVVQEMARRVMMNTAHPELNGQRVVYLHIGELLAAADTNASQLAIISHALRELELAGNVIAVIDGLGSILASEGEVRVNLTDVLLPFFSSLAVRVVVIISNEEYHLRLKTNEELVHFFEVVYIESVSPEVTLQVLALAAPQLERQTGVYLPYKTLRAIIEGTESILPHIPYPERAFDFLEEALSQAGGRGWTMLESAHIDALITQKIGVPVGRLRSQEKEKLLQLEDLIHERVVNQSPAVAAVSQAMIRARAGIRSKERPIGNFLFLGPTGVGKTETAKTLASVYFGSEEYLTRLDMSEFQNPESIDSLIGSSQHPVGRLTALISEHPFTVLLLDEFEKAHDVIHQLFLQVFDEARLTDSQGQVVSFKHAIIIATSNAGAEFIRENVVDGKVPEHFDQQLRDHILSQGIFRPELINRFDGVITFTPLSRVHIREVAQKMLAKLNKRLDAEHGVTVAITPQLLEYLAKIGYDPQFGARPMARAIQNTVEYAIAQRVLLGTLEPGQEVVLEPAQMPIPST